MPTAEPVAPVASPPLFTKFIDASEQLPITDGVDVSRILGVFAFSNCFQFCLRSCGSFELHILLNVGLLFTACNRLGGLKAFTFDKLFVPTFSRCRPENKVPFIILSRVTV